jgi:DNA-binding NtrC family response regulator
MDVLEDQQRIQRLIQCLHESQAVAKLIGKAPAFVRAIAHLPMIAKSGAAILIHGETGTGKELVARAIHYIGSRAHFPFVPVNCGLLSDTLLEDELFGHERGAFTDAHSSRRGLLAQAEGGTLFLDEIDALSKRAQVSLLRVLQDKKYRPVGSAKEQHADVHIVTATNADLDGLVQADRFRADLFFRLCVFSIALPALRERREDILLLAAHFLKKHALSPHAVQELTPRAAATLTSYEWPGNVRELENALIRGMYATEGEGPIDVCDLGLKTSDREHSASEETSGPQPYEVLKREAISRFDREYLTRLMAAHQGNVTRAAQAAGKERRVLGRLLKKNQIDPKHFVVRRFRDEAGTPVAQQAGPYSPT